MTDRPILFSAPMVLALQSGAKTQTRRILKPQPEHLQHYEWKGKVLHDSEYRHWCYKGHVGHDNWASITDQLRPALPIEIGDRLWVKETFTMTQHSHAVYRADARDQFGHRWSEITPGDPKREVVWKPSIFMPRVASRLTLVVTDVRVQRLREISNGDAAAEGVTEHEEIVDITSTPSGHPVEIHDYRYRVEGIGDDDEGYLDEWSAFRNLWVTINGQESWDADPWVAAYTFTVHKANIDQMGRAA